MLQEQETFQSVKPVHANEQELSNKQQLTNVQAKLKRFNEINETIFCATRMEINGGVSKVK